MGINISVYNVETNKEHLVWDSTRFGGDKEFAMLDIDYEYKDLSPQDGEYYRRPEDLDLALKIIKKNRKIINYERFRDIFLEMKKNKNLYFYFGY